MSRSLAATFANVHDFDAVGDGHADDSLAIQAAIRNPFGKHVLFPAGVYRIGPNARLAGWTDGGAGVEFDVDGQRACFLAGARLQLEASAGVVRISGSDQVFEGMRIHVGGHDGEEDDGSGVAGLGSDSPMLDVVACDRLTFRDLRVSANVGVSALVRLRSVASCRFTGGRLLGNSDTAIGLQLGREDGAAPTAVSGISALGLTIDSVGIGVAISAVAEAVRFTGCRFGDTPLGGIVVGGERATTVRCLSVLGCRFTEGAPDRWLHVSENATVRGMTVSGTRFGALVSETADDPARPGDGSPDHGRIFQVDGALSGALVRGCVHDGAGDARGTVAWELGGVSVLGGVADIANAWEAIETVGGTRTGRVSQFTSDEEGTLSITATAVKFDTTLPVSQAALGFFGTTPTAGDGPFTLASPGASELADGASAAEVREVLKTLVADLQQMGLLRST